MRGLSFLVGAGLVVIAAGCSSTSGGSDSKSCAPSGLCDGAQICTSQDSNGVCMTVTYETGAGSFQCATCADCAQALAEATTACGSNSTSGSGGTNSNSDGICTTGTTCADGTSMSVCTANGTNGECSSITYSVDGKPYTCVGCTSCSAVQAEAAEACANATATGNSSGSSGSGSSSGSSGSSGGQSSSSSGSSGGQSSSSSGSSGGSGSSSGSSGSSGGVVDAGPTTQTCQAEAAESCLACCQGLYAAGFQDIVADVQSCVCGTGPCGTSCADEYCSSGSFAATADGGPDTCETCFDDALAVDGGTCLNGVDTACAGNADCTAYLTCADGCPAQ